VKPLIFICSPYRGDVEANKENARRYSRFAFEQGGIPFAPHLLFTQFLNDDNPAERDAGLCLGLELLSRCDALWAFGNPTMGMAMEIQEAKRLGIPVRRFDADCEVTTCE
jgi:hypothetical protein